MRLRIVTAAVAATLAVTGLAGCRTNVGTAATVEGQRISESDVNDYLTPTGVSSSAAAAQAQQGGRTASPRAQVLQVLIQEQVFERTLRANGGVPSEGRLAASHDDAASLLLQTQLTGDALDAALAKGLPESGIRPKFAKTYLRTQELEYALITRKNLKQLSELLALIDKAHISVSTNARYGTWDPKTLSLTGRNSVPSYLTVQPGSSNGQLTG